MRTDERQKELTQVLRHLTLFAGMYCITVTLFTLETGSFVKGLLVGLLAAWLKSLWATVHFKLHAWHQRRKAKTASKPGFDPIELGM